VLGEDLQIASSPSRLVGRYFPGRTARRPARHLPGPLPPEQFEAQTRLHVVREQRCPLRQTAAAAEVRAADQNVLKGFPIERAGMWDGARMAHR